MFTMLTSLLIGDMLLSSGIALAEPSQLAKTVAINSTSAEETGDPFDRDGDPANIGREFEPDVPIENCFWKMTVGADPYHNAFYPDQQTSYPTALFSLPRDKKLALPGKGRDKKGYVKITGEFPHARSMTFSAYFYDPDSATLVSGDHQIVDYEIEPDEGSTNPFRDGAKRTDDNRSYTLKWVPETLPDKEEDREPNTLYLGRKEFPNIGYIVVMRVYVADQGTNLFGGTTLPEATIVRPDGSEIVGDAICDPEYSPFTGDMSSVYPSPAFDPVAYRKERDRTEWYNQDRPESWPAQDPPYIIREWSAKYNFCANFEQGPDNADKCPKPVGTNVGSGGFGNSTTVYLTTWMDRNLGEVLVLQGKKPKTPKTYFGEESETFDTSDAEMRYFSWTTDEPLSRSRVIDSVFDEEIPVDENGYYTVVVSRPSYRPENARYECGYAWLEFPAAGDGFGDVYLGELRNRWQLPLNDFQYAPHEAEKPGEEPEVMGEYFPHGKYYQTPQAFDNDFPCKPQPAPLHAD